MNKGDFVRIRKTASFVYPFNDNGKLNPCYIFPPNIEIVTPKNFSSLSPRNKKCMILEECDFVGILIGKTKRGIGTFIKGHAPYSTINGYDEGEPSTLDIDTWIKVWVIEPVGNGTSYYHPVLAREEDIEYPHS